MVLRRWLTLFLAVVMLATAVGCENVVPTTVTGSGRPEMRDFNLSGFSGK